MDGGIDWFWFALTVPLAPTVAILGGLIWLRTARIKQDEDLLMRDDCAGIYLAAPPEQAGADIDRNGQH